MRKLLLAALLASGCGAGLLDHTANQLPGGGGCQLGESAQSCGPICKVCEAPEHGTAVCGPTWSRRA